MRELNGLAVLTILVVGARAWLRRSSSQGLSVPEQLALCAAWLINGAATLTLDYAGWEIAGSWFVAGLQVSSFLGELLRPRTTTKENP